MPTNDERREVAARLREHQHGDVRAYTYEDGMIASWWRLKEALSAEGDDPQEDHIMMFGYLADLIETEPERTVNLTEAVDAICGQMCGDGWDWSMRAETVVRTVAEMCGAKVVE
jgi:hypothetical protein